MGCVERAEQGGVASIEKGALRVGRRVRMEKDGSSQMALMWYHARCMFESFTRSKKKTRIIESVDDLENFETIAVADQAYVRGVISGVEDVRGPVSRAPEESAAAHKRRRGASVSPPPKKRRDLLEPETRTLKVGDRVWTHSRVRPKAGLAEGVFSKSQKPELAMVRGDIEDQKVLVQFESAEHERDRIERYHDRRGEKLRAWLRYARVFEGKKQTVPVNWIQWRRKPPNLCSCKRQEWGHGTDCGICCSIKSTKKIWGVCQ